MRDALVLVILAALAGACGKKQPPASPTPPADEKAGDADKAGDQPDAEEAAPTMRKEDPCTGGE